MTITFYFPTNYKHGCPDKSYYKEEIEILSISPRTQKFLQEIFKQTELYKKLLYFSFRIYTSWIPVKDKIDHYYASPLIFVYYDQYCLKYFHIPSTSNVKTDLYLLNGKNNKLPDDKTLLISENIDKLEGEYVISLN